MFHLFSIRILLSLALVLITEATFANTARVNSPFSADVPVRSQALQARREGAEQGLLDVLVRVSGSERVRTDALIVDEVTRAIRYVEQFEYRDLNDKKLVKEGYSHILNLQFSQGQVKALLRDSDKKFWSLNRPSVLVWLVEDSSSGGKQLVGADKRNSVIQGLKDGARYRGIPLEFPLLDFNDRVALSPVKAWNLNEAAIKRASQRYDADAILVGKYTTTSSGLRWSNWQYFFRDQSRIYDLRDVDARAIGKQAITPLADYLASLFAVRLSVEESDFYFAEVDNIRSYQDYRALIERLNGLDTLDDIRLDAAVADVLKLRFKSEASVTQLTSLLTLTRHLKTIVNQSEQTVPEWERIPLGRQDNPLRYRWLP